jgi:phage tail tape-measure protein
MKPFEGRSMVPTVPDNLMVFSGNANPRLAHAVVQHLNLPLGRAQVSRFSDGEVMVEVNENVRGKDVFVLQSTRSSARRPAASPRQFPTSAMRGRTGGRARRGWRSAPKSSPT